MVEKRDNRMKDSGVMGIDFPTEITTESREKVEETFCCCGSFNLGEEGGKGKKKKGGERRKEKKEKKKKKKEKKREKKRKKEKKEKKNKHANDEE